MIFLIHLNIPCSKAGSLEGKAKRFLTRLAECSACQKLAPVGCVCIFMNFAAVCEGHYLENNRACEENVRNEHS
jgi:hypothetical protein